MARTQSLSASMLLNSDVDVNISQLPSEGLCISTKREALSLLPVLEI